jgi:hypothetical protein
MLSAAAEFDAEDWRRGMQDLAERIAYVDYFAAALRYVPDFRPHEEGALLGKALLHVLMPRLLFPDKPPTPRDTDITAKYTGLSFVGAGLWTSISMGYMADSYVDFGAFGMFVPIFGLGLLMGWIYRVLLRYRQLPVLLNYGLATTVILVFSAYETTLIKVIGGVLTLFIVMIVLQRYLLPRIVPWLMAPSGRQRRVSRVANSA